MDNFMDNFIHLYKSCDTFFIKKIFEGLSNNKVIHKRAIAQFETWGKSSKTRFEHEQFFKYI
jgi:hypothetical protein